LLHLMAIYSILSKSLLQLLVIKIE